MSTFLSAPGCYKQTQYTIIQYSTSKTVQGKNFWFYTDQHFCFKHKYAEMLWNQIIISSYKDVKYTCLYLEIHSEYMLCKIRMKNPNKKKPLCFVLLFEELHLHQYTLFISKKLPNCQPLMKPCFIVEL